MKNKECLLFAGFLLFSLSLISFASASADWWNSDWNYRMPLIVEQSGTETLANFPIVVNGFDYVNTAELISEGKMKEDCSDIRFTDSAGNLLDYQFGNDADPIYGCDSEKTLIYLSIPNLPAEGTTVYMYYGNSDASLDEENIWGDYSAVLNFNEGQGGIAYDSATNKDGMIYGTNWAIGKVAKSLEFDGTDDYVELENSESVNPDNITLEAWIKKDTSGYQTIIGKSWNGRILSLDITGDDKLLFHIWLSGSGNGYKTLDSISLGEWHYIAASFSNLSGPVNLYIDGEESGTYEVGGEADVGTPRIKIGYFDPTNNNWFDGEIDEVRISNLVRSSDWIKRSYEQDLSSLGNEETNEPQPDLTELERRVGVLEERVVELQNENILLKNNITLLIEEDKSLGERLNDTESRISSLEVAVNAIIVLLDGFKIKVLDYLGYLPDGLKQQMLCGTLKNQSLSSVIDLGMNCTISYLGECKCVKVA